MRRLVRETTLAVDNLVAPLFVKEGIGEPQPITSMPGHSQHSLESLRKEVAELASLGIPAIVLFGIRRRKMAPARAPTATMGSSSARCASCAPIWATSSF